MDADALGVLGHELRAPLTGILGLATYVLEEETDLPKAVHEKLALIQDDAGYLLGMLDGLLLSMRGASGAEAEEARVLEPLRVVDRLLASMRPNARRKGIDLVLEAVGDLPTRVFLPIRMLRQILTNLLANAIRHTERGEVRVRVEALDGRELAVTVADSGSGVPVAERQRIFQRYVQAAGQGPRPGLGLGLWLAAQLAEALGGAIDLSSQTAAGSAFRVRLPLRPAGTARDPTPTRAAPVLPADLGPDPARPLVGRRILVVDDAPSTRLLLAAWLKRQGVRVSLAADASQALAAMVAAAGPLDAVLIEWRLGGNVAPPGAATSGDGGAVLSALRQAGCAALAIALASDAWPSSVQARAAGFAAVLSQPIVFAELQVILAERLAKVATGRYEKSDS